MSQAPPETGAPANNGPQNPVLAKKDTLLKRFFGTRESSVFIVLLLICLFLYRDPATHEKFFARPNWLNLSRQVALLGIFAIGETVVILTGGIDLSLGSLIGFSGMLLALMVTKLDARMYTGGAIGVAIVLALVFSFLVGTIHANLIHKLKLPPFVVTLASLSILHSQALLVNNQLPIELTKFTFILNLANGSLFEKTPFPIPIPLALLVVLGVITHLILSRARIGRYVYSVGSNEVGTALSGVNVGRVKLFAYGVAALLGGVAGILYAGYSTQGDPRNGIGYELNAVAAAVIGGAALTGGQGTVLGTVLGACLLNVILTGLNMLDVPNQSLWQGTVVGSVLLLAVLTSAYQQHRKKKAA